MQRKTKKLLVDGGLYTGLCIIVVTGFILEWVIPRGGGHRGDRFFLGLHRHGWTDIHLFFAIAFLSLLVVHLVWNWKSTVNALKRHFGAGWKSALGTAGLAWIPLLCVAWFVAMIGSCLGCQ